MAISVLRAAALSFGVLGFSVFVGGCRYREGKTWTETRVVYTLASGSCPAQLPLDTESIRSGSGEVLDAELISTGETITQADLCWYELAWGDSVASAQMRDNFRCSKQSTLAAARSHYVHYSSEVPRLNAPEFEGRGSTRDGMLYPGAVGCVDGRRV